MNKHNIIIILCFMGLSLFFNISSATVIFPNHDYESGTIGGAPTSWSIAGGTTLTNTTAYSGINSVKFTGAGQVWTTNIDMTNVDKVSFWYRITSGNRYYIRFQSNNDNFFTPSGVQGWTLFECDTTGVSGLDTVLIVSDGGACGNVDLIWNDTYPPPPDCEINFYPDVTETENFPLIVNYSVNSTCTNLNQIYVYRNDSHIYTYYLYDSQEGSINMSELIQPSKNVTYIVTLRTILCNVVAYDIIDYIFNETIEFPTPEPTPDITPLPTYTPPPTPIPPTQPQIDNGTLNMTWLQGYYNLVDGVMNGLFQPVFNATGYFMFPMTLILDAGGNVMTQSILIFDIAEDKILIATSILAVFFNSIPDKVTYLMIYYLSWVVILILFKGET